MDVLRCCFCGMCEEACPKDAIKLSTIYEMSCTSRPIYDKEFLLEQRGSK
ncbi:MAG: 4Fe-4S binding protein [Candidatus Poribacteria bacterium]